jgi:hypothetical protein
LEHDVNDVTVAYRSANRYPDFFVDSPANPLGFGDVKTRPGGLVRMEPGTNQHGSTFLWLSNDGSGLLGRRLLNKGHPEGWDGICCRVRL